MTESVDSLQPASGLSQDGGHLIEEVRPNRGTPAVSRRAQWLVWLWFGPPFALGLLHFWLGTRTDALPDAEPIISAPYVQTAAGDTTAALHALMWRASQPLLISVAILAVALLLAWYAIRRWGWMRVTPWATGLWCVICAGTALTLVANYVNRAYLTPLPPVTATVIEAQPYPTSERSVGGALTWLQPPAGADGGAVLSDATPWRVRIEGADFQAMPKGARVTLQRARGALWGEYLLGSNAPQAMPLPEYAPGPESGDTSGQASHPTQSVPANTNPS